MPKFSVIIPTYNRAIVLKEAVRSVLDQTYEDFEIIVSDDGSADNTASMVKEFTDPRLKILTLGHCGVIGAVRNAAIRQANGQLLAFLDSDDIWFKQKLDSVNQAFEADERIILVCHNMLQKQSGRSGIIHRYGPVSQNMYERLLFKGNCIGTSATAVKKDAIIKAGFFSEDPRFIGAEDYECWMRLARMGGFFFLDQVLGEYRITGQNISRNVQRITESRINVIRHHYQEIFNENSAGYNRLVALRIADLLCGSARALQVEGYFRDAVQYYLQSLKANALSMRTYVGLVTSLLRLRLTGLARMHLALAANSISY